MPINPDVPTHPVRATRQPAKPKVDKVEREPLDPITVHLWRYPRPERHRLLDPFIDHQVKIERWWGRVAANGDQIYRGTLLAVATSTTGSTADFAILKTVDGTVWAISTAQIAFIELDEPAPARKRGGRRPRATQEPIDAAA